MLWPLWIILTGSNQNVWITGQHSWFLMKPISLGYKPIKQPSFALALKVALVLLPGISAWSWILIKVFLEFNLCVKPPLLGAELLLPVRLGALRKRRERGVG